MASTFQLPQMFSTIFLRWKVNSSPRVTKTFSKQEFLFDITKAFSLQGQGNLGWDSIFTQPKFFPWEMICCHLKWKSVPLAFWWGQAKHSYQSHLVPQYKYDIPSSHSPFPVSLFEIFLYCLQQNNDNGMNIKFTVHRPNNSYLICCFIITTYI
jgi:hypothetical protein